MSDLSNLKKRIETEFSAPARTLDNRDVTQPVSTSAADHPSMIDRYRKLMPMMACLAVLSSAMLLVLGIDRGIYLLPAVLAFAGLSGAALLLSDWRQAARRAAERTQATEESAGDSRWERSETSQLLSTIHDALGDIALIREPGGRIVQANAVFCRVTGWLRPEHLTCAEIGIEFEPAGQPHRFLVRIATDEGVQVFDWHDVVAREPSSGRFMLHSIARDITREHARAQESEDARRRAEQASHAKSQLLATVSHEIRTPLSGILGMSHLITKTRLTSEQKNYLAGMRQSGHALVQLVEDLLDFSSIEAGRFQLRPTQEPLRETIESVVEMLSHRAHEKGIEIGATVDAALPALMEFDAARLRQVLFNVIGNAVKFTQTGGVLVEASLDGREVVVRVDDSGPGMTAEEQSRIFDEFEQAGANQQRAGGSGLGLAISRRIMEAFGGALTVSSVPGNGSTFEIRFPAVGCELSPTGEVRSSFLAKSSVLVLAPRGPAADALAKTIVTLGGTCDVVETLEAARIVIRRRNATGVPISDIIVDHRQAAEFRRLMTAMPELEGKAPRKTYLVNPEERSVRPINQMDGYHAWLIRPLREKSLVAVLQGRMKGMEVRDAINDNRPVLRDVPPAEERPVAAKGILLAEDDPINAFMVRAMLEKAGHTVHVVGDHGALGSALFDAKMRADFVPELLITDLNMPAGDCLETLKRLRDGDRDHAVPAIVLTSDMRAETRERLLLAGASTVLAKPADPKTLTLEISRLLDR